MLPNFLDMGEESPPILPGKAVEAEEAHHPLKGSGKTGRLIGGDSPIGEPKFEWNGLVGFRRPSSVEQAKDPLRLLVASQNNRGWLECIGSESIEPVRMIEQGDVVALLMKMVCSCQAGQSRAEHKDSV